MRGPEGLYFERKSLLEGADGDKRPRDRREVRDDVAAVTAAFANADGGVLVLGVEDDRTVTGHRYPNDVVDDILAVPERRLAPPLNRGVRATVDGIEILVFVVETSLVPVMVDGNGYPCRAGDRVVRMPADRIAAWKERGLVESWEARRSELTVADLDQAILTKAIEGSVLRTTSTEDYLVKRNLADYRGRDLVLRRAAELLFAREAHRIDHPNAGVRVFRVIGRERHFGAHHNVEELPRLEANLPTVIDSVFAAIGPLLRTPKRLRGSRFEDVPEYPPFVWKEAIINAIAHRDYAVVGGCTEVWLFEDRMEVTNPGGLVADVSLEALTNRERVHMCRNPRIVHCLVDLGAMREQGEGIPRMFAEMEVQFLAPPELKAGPHSFGVTLRNAPTITSADAEWLGALQDEGLSEPQARAMALVRLRGQVNNAGLRDATGLDTLSASAELRSLRDRGFLELRAAGAASYYVVGPKLRSDRGELEADRPGFDPDRRGFDADRPGFESDRGGFEGLPADLQASITALGRRPRRENLRPVIFRLCTLHPWRPIELTRLLGFADAKDLTKRHLAPMVDSGQLERTHPEEPAHPRQAYRAVRHVSALPEPE